MPGNNTWETRFLPYAVHHGLPTSSTDTTSSTDPAAAPMPAAAPICFVYKRTVFTFLSIPVFITKLSLPMYIMNPFAPTLPVYKCTSAHNEAQKAKSATHSLKRPLAPVSFTLPRDVVAAAGIGAAAGSVRLMASVLQVGKPCICPY